MIVFYVKEEKDLHGYLGDQKGGLWEAATYPPAFFPARCGHLTNLWQIGNELQ